MERSQVVLLADDAKSASLCAQVKSTLEQSALSGISEADTDLEGCAILVSECPSHDAIDHLREMNPTGLRRVLVIIGSAHLEPGNNIVWQLLAAGAAEVVVWQPTLEFALAVEARITRWVEVDGLVNSDVVRGTLVGRSSSWVRCLRTIVQVAAFSNASLLVCGESGTGKEQVARVVHALDPRREKRDLVVCDCSTVVSELSGSEFFGHERGAFTGATTSRDGSFARAHQGTLFLDEVGELPLGLQAQLLRVIQERTYKRVGGNIWFETDFRLVCATNRELETEMQAHRFRSDLYHRIASWTLHLPPLRERPEDILPLVEHFLRELSVDGRALVLDESVRQYLITRSYPGNVRELRQLVTRIAACHVGPGPVTVGDIPVRDRPSDTLELNWPNSEFRHAVSQGVALGFGLRDIGRLAADTAIDAALDYESGNLQRAAKRLGVTDRALQMRRAQKVA